MLPRIGSILENNQITLLINLLQIILTDDGSVKLTIL